jgi:putative ATPase
MQSFEFIGLPEGIFPIVEATIYLATAPKSNSTMSYFKAYKLLEDEGVVEVPDHLKDANRDAKALGHGQNYKYPHEHPDHHIGQQYLPQDLLGRYFYRPSDQGYEVEVKERLELWRNAQRKALGIQETSELPDLSESQVEEIKRHHTRGKK